MRCILGIISFEEVLGKTSINQSFMKTHILLFTVLFAVLSFVETGMAAPNNHTDFLPKYRSQNKNFALTRIDYTSDKMIVHFQYVIDKDGMRVKLPGASTANAWKLFTSSRSGTGLTEYATGFNERLNTTTLFFKRRRKCSRPPARYARGR